MRLKAGILFYGLRLVLRSYPTGLTRSSDATWFVFLRMSDQLLPVRKDAEASWAQIAELISLAGSDSYGKVKVVNASKEEAERKLKEVVGVAGGGKSSLIDAFRGLRNKDIGSAQTGFTETTLAMARYANPSAEYPYVWYDIPGAGTLKIPDWQYFNARGLYVFDCITVMRFKIPTYIVRSKADQHIRNTMKDMGYDSDDDESEDQKKKLH
ncbi:hypothetical protein EDD22DRAFT_954706 [Suillus occidentalis]|nr:hypothetical protein EDD22DRAFT_954706 [Suillus occidentalis]